jgi:hypothetical protein
MHLREQNINLIREIMPTEVKRYVCNLCKTVHYSYEDALNCEMLGMPAELNEPEFNVGETINFEAEGNGMGVRWSYSTETGVIKDKRMVLITDQPVRHAWIIMVQVNSKQGTPMWERGLMICDTQFGRKLASPAEMCWRIGYIEATKE